MTLEIANCAADHLGISPFSKWPANDRNADVISRQMKKAAAHVLRRCSWSELTLTVCPDQLTVCDPCCDFPSGFCYAFSLPRDFISVYDVEPQSDYCDEPKWSVRKIRTPNGKAQALLTDIEKVRLEYICLPDNLDTLDGDVKDLIALRVAIESAPRLKADKSLKDMLRAEFEDLLADADLVSASQDAEQLEIPNGYLLRPRIGNRKVF